MRVLPFTFQLYRTSSEHKISEKWSAQPSVAILAKQFQLKCNSLSLAGYAVRLAKFTREKMLAGAILTGVKDGEADTRHG
jgi:hypothetical protein